MPMFMAEEIEVPAGTETLVTPGSRPASAEVSRWGPRRSRAVTTTTSTSAPTGEQPVDRAAAAGAHGQHDARLPDDAGGGLGGLPVDRLGGLLGDPAQRARAGWPTRGRRSAGGGRGRRPSPRTRPRRSRRARSRTERRSSVVPRSNWEVRHELAGEAGLAPGEGVHGRAVAGAEHPHAAREELGVPQVARLEEGHELAAGALEAAVEGAAQLGAGAHDDPHAGVAGGHVGGDGAGGVDGPAVEDQQLPLVERLGLQGGDRRPEQRPDVLGAHQDGDDRAGGLGGVLVGARVGVEVGQHLPLAGGPQRVVAELAPRDVRVAAAHREGGVTGGVRGPPGERPELVVAGGGVLLVDPLGVDERVRSQPVAPRPLGDVPERRRAGRRPATRPCRGARWPRRAGAARCRGC